MAADCNVNFISYDLFQGIYNILSDIMRNSMGTPLISAETIRDPFSRIVEYFRLIKKVKLKEINV